MRLSLGRLALVVGGIAVIVSCDGGVTQTRFGNGIAGGSSGTAPITPPAPGSADTTKPFVQIDTPATTNQLVNVGDSIYTVVHINDDRQLQSLTILGVRYTGNANLGTLQQIIRYPAIVVPPSGAPAFHSSPIPLVDTIIRRYLKPSTPIDSTVDSLIIMAIAQDAAGNVDTARRKVNVVTGPSVQILAPIPGDSVPQGIPINVSVRVTHNAGVRTVRTTVVGDPTWPTPLNAVFNDTVTGIQRDVTYNHLVTVPANATVGTKITVNASATDITSNPGSTTPVVIFVRQFGTKAPRVTQTVPDRLELTDSIIINASGDGIASVGFKVIDSTNTTVKDSSVALSSPFTSNAQRTMRLNLASTYQGKRMRISSYATDSAGLVGYSVAVTTSQSQTSSNLAHTDSTLIVYGRTYKFPRTGTIGDVVVDTIRSHVLLSNMDANRLEVWDNASRAFNATGVAVGSQPWGLAVGIDPNELLVANSGGTNISRVNLGTGPISTIQEDLSRRIRTRTNFLYVLSEFRDAAGAVHFGAIETKMYSDRPQYIGQTSDQTIYYSTRPTDVAKEGTVRYLNPNQTYPDQRTFVFVRSISTAVDNLVVVDADSVVTRSGSATGIPDTVYLYDHLPGSSAASVAVRTPTCTTSATPAPNVSSCGVLGTNDPRYDARFPNGLTQGLLSAAVAIHTYDATCTPNCSDMHLIEDATPVGLSDTNFVAVSADRNWIAFGEGNTNPGLLLMASASPSFFSPIITQVDLTNNAAERVFGLAIDSTGQTISAHGSQSYFASVDQPFHLRLQGIYADAGSGGAGVAFHPRANGVTSPESERLGFVAAGDRTVHAVDIAYFIKRGKYDLKHQLYGPLRVSRRMAGDDPTIILKLYGISKDGGLTVIDLRAGDITTVP